MSPIVIKTVIYGAFIGIVCGGRCTTNCANILTLQNNLQQALEDVTTLLSEGCNDSVNSTHPRDCEDIKDLGYRKTGVYTIYPVFAPSGFQVRCDMDTDGGGWTVIQRRVSNSDFYKTWNEYKVGFGNLSENFWLGNEQILALTRSEGYALRIDLTAPDGESRYAKYDYFAIEGEDFGYQLWVSGYKGSAGNSLSHQDSMKFTTRDNDLDTNPSNCAVLFHGAWWYKGCHASNLNGEYGNNAFGKGLNWATWKGYYISMIQSEMKIKRK